MDGPPTLSPAAVQRWLDGVCADGHGNILSSAESTCSVTAYVTSGASELTPRSLLATIFLDTTTMEKMSTTKLAVLGAPMWVAKRSADDWTATVGSDQAVIEDCCTDGAAILSKMNPETYHMPLGVRMPPS